MRCNAFIKYILEIPPKINLIDFWLHQCILYFICRVVGFILGLEEIVFAGELVIQLFTFFLDT